MIRFGVIGYGYWGPNIVRNLHIVSDAKVVAVCDKSTASLERAKRTYPEIRVTTMNGDVTLRKTAASK